MRENYERAEVGWREILRKIALPEVRSLNRTRVMVSNATERPALCPVHLAGPVVSSA